MAASKTDPLILTLNLNNEAQLLFNQLRQKHFPPEHNYLDAHLTLFHHLPANEIQISRDIEVIMEQYDTLSIHVTGIVSIGNGTAYKLESGPLLQLHRQLQLNWAQWLIPQDKQKLWPHITIQNKVEPSIAKKLIAKLMADFKPFTIQGTGLSIWAYKGGPWSFVKSFDF